MATLSGIRRVVSSSWRRPPSVYSTHDGGPRHTTWLEHFFDLVFLVAVGELSHLFSADVTPVEFASFVGLFLLFWYTWLGFSYYADEFDTDDLVHRVGMVAFMFTVIVLSVTIDDVVRGDSAPFAMTYLVLRLLLIGMYARAWMNIPELHTFLTDLIAVNAVSAGVWAMSLSVAEPTRFVVWALAFVIGIAGTFGIYVGIDRIPTQISHLPERFVLFTIIVLGEMILVVAVGTADTAWQVASAFTALDGFLIAVLLWWIYFTYVDDGAFDHMLRSIRGPWTRARESLFIYLFGHFFVFLGIVVSGVGIKLAITAAAAGLQLGGNGRFMLCGGVCLYLLGCMTCDRVTPGSVHAHVLLARSSVGALIGFLGISGHTAEPLVLTSLILLSLAGLVAFEAIHPHAATLVDRAGR